MNEGQVKMLSGDPMSAVLEPALKVGAMCGGAGFVVGGTVGILTSPTPLLFATFSSLQWFVLGSTFWGTRGSILHAWNPVHQTPNDLIKASTLAGGITGGVVAALTRGRRNVLPGMLMFSLGGFAGQWVQNAWAASKTRREEAAGESSEGVLGGMSGKGWSLMKVMSDEEYAERLKHQQLAVDAEISILDDKIAALRKQQEQETKNPESNSTGP